jgi:hypothetical protein
MHYRIVIPSAERATRIFHDVREYLAADREMQRDRARLVKIGCGPVLPIQLQGSPRPASLLA